MVTLPQRIPALQEVLHPVARGGVPETDRGARELATLDFDGSHVVFFEWDDAN